MSVLRKLLLSMLVACTLGYGSAWAFDGHALAIDSDLLDQVMATVITTDIQPDGHLSGDSGEKHAAANDLCDHCGHISAHLQAIFTQNGYLCNINQSSELLEFSEDLISFSLSPDLRPPRV